MVCAFGGVFLDASAELAEDQGGDVLVHAGSGEVLLEGGQAARELTHELVVDGLLTGVGVEAAQRQVEDAAAEVTVDQACDELEALGEVVLGVVDGGGGVERPY